MFKCVLCSAPKSGDARFRRTFLLIGFLLLCGQLSAQKLYDCHLKISWEGKVEAKAKEELSIIAEKYYYGKLLGLLGKYDGVLLRKQGNTFSFIAKEGRELRLGLKATLLASQTKQEVFKIRADEPVHQQRKIRLQNKAFLVLDFKLQPIDAQVAKAKNHLRVTSKAAKIQGVSGILVDVVYRLPTGISKGMGYIRAMDGRVTSGKPIWLYQVFKGQHLANNLLVKLNDTTRFQLFVPFHERPYWISNIGFQLIHASEGRLLEHFWTSSYTKQEKDYDVTTNLFLQCTSPDKVQSQGVQVGVKIDLPKFYPKDMRKNQITLHVSGDAHPGGANIWHYRMFSVDELAQKNDQIIVQKSFIPYSWLAKFADTIHFNLKTKMFLMAHRGIQFYNGYPRQQSHLVATKKQDLELILPALRQVKVRPMLFKSRRAWGSKEKTVAPRHQKVQVLVRVNTYELYRSKSYSYRKTIRFNKINKDVLHLALNDKITIEVKDNSYPSQVLFKTEVACTANILSQKVWKLKDKNGNYLKIAVQKVTTEKDKLLHSNDKKQTKMLGGSR
ncbi:hypothetical protein BKI52_17580 [marine bacterium AO1-C]|nr:hypothetical protein BKI52_17580 [marine bacterium AO1-C]